MNAFPWNKELRFITNIFLCATCSLVFVACGNTSETGSKEFSKRDELASQELIITRHAYCRMECRSITRTDIQTILQFGAVNERKSDPQDKPCATYAIEGMTKDGRSLRVIFADCDDQTKLVTAIDLGMEKEREKCDCK